MSNEGIADDNVVVLSPLIKSMTHLFTKIRDQNTASKEEFCKYANRLMSIICEEGLARVSHIKATTVTTPTGSTYNGETIDTESVVAVSIIRAADSMLDCLLRAEPQIKVGKILIQRDEVTAKPKLYYSKLPNLKEKSILLLDPMLATGGSAKAAVQVLLEAGASEDKILFVNVVCAPQGIALLRTSFPKLKIVTGQIDQGLSDKAYILPGLGDYGDRFFGTD